MIIREKWTAILLISIILQAIIYVISYLFHVVDHSALWVVFVAGFVSIILQMVGYFIILKKSRNKNREFFTLGKIENKLEK